MNSRNSMAANVTVHCLTGCAIGEIAGLMLGTALGLSPAVTIALAVGLAFLFGYALSTLPPIHAGPGLFAALTAAFIAAFPVNRYLIDEGKGHALSHQFIHGVERAEHPQQGAETSLDQHGHQAYQSHARHHDAHIASPRPRGDSHRHG